MVEPARPAPITVTSSNMSLLQFRVRIPGTDRVPQRARHVPEFLRWSTDVLMPAALWRETLADGLIAQLGSSGGAAKMQW